jgi:hypothetical protein
MEVASGYFARRDRIPYVRTAAWRRFIIGTRRPDRTTCGAAVDGAVRTLLLRLEYCSMWRACCDASWGRDVFVNPLE